MVSSDVNRDSERRTCITGPSSKKGKIHTRRLFHDGTGVN